MKEMILPVVMLCPVENNGAKGCQLRIDSVVEQHIKAQLF